MNPFIDGKRHKIGLDLFVKGFSAPDLITAYHRLTANPEQERLILESACIDEIDDEYNDGEWIQDEEGIYEAVTVRRFSQTDSRMRALGRVFTKYLDGITPEEAIIGKPKKSGLFATVTAQIPFSDGQVISIVFHSPDGNAKQIAPDDSIIAFRWLLNKRDITHVVSPEGEGEVSLEEVGKRIAQLVQKNSARFQATQKEVKAQHEQLDALKTEATAMETENQNMMAELQDKQDEAATLQGKIDRTTELLNRQKEINSDLENKLAGMQAAKEAENARVEAERKAAEEQAAKEKAAEEARLKAEQEAAMEQHRKEQEEQTRQAEETKRLMEIGQREVPGIRLGDAEEAGRQWEMYQKGDLTESDWFQLKQDYYDSGKAKKPDSVWQKSTPFNLDPFGRNMSSYEGRHLIDKRDTEFFYRLVDGKWYLRKWQPEKGNEYNMDLIGAFNTLENAQAVINNMEARLHPDNKTLPDPYHDNSNQTELNALRDEARSLGWEKEADLLWLAKDVTGLKDLIAVERTARAKKAISTPETTNQAETEAVSTLNGLLSGKYDSDTLLFGNMLDDAAGKLEQAGVMDKYDGLLNQAADYLTGLLKKKAA
ncbi:hypothetical protein [Desulfatirhabdium butyrativorans]|uniref:defense against restriction DarA-related protein n=1 Tax=Desulfatirhabdium butyrativorans TaxID=340467 RepID=UPI0003F562B6|nr:hypothetical protein [Desulfatirhabdium butyrativorans]